MNTITTDDLLDLIADAADALDIAPTIDPRALLDEYCAREGITIFDEFGMRETGQYVADILADVIKVSQFGDSLEQMRTDAGLRLEQWSTVLWIEEPCTLVVWLGNLEDYDMVHLGRAQFSN